LHDFARLISLRWLVFRTNAANKHHPSGAATVPLGRLRTLRTTRRDPVCWNC
jgi:hypothetical protein